MRIDDTIRRVLGEEIIELLDIKGKVDASIRWALVVVVSLVFATMKTYGLNSWPVVFAPLWGYLAHAVIARLLGIILCWRILVKDLKEK